MNIVIPLLVVLAMVVGIVLVIRRIMKSVEAKHWPTVPGRIVYSNVERQVSSGSGSSNRSVTWKASITYDYEVDGIPHTSDKVYGMAVSSSNRSRALGLVHKYAVGTEVEVYYNPAKPADAMLEPGVPSSAVFLLVLLFIFLGTFGYLLVAEMGIV